MENFSSFPEKHTIKPLYNSVFKLTKQQNY